MAIAYWNILKCGVPLLKADNFGIMLDALRRMELGFPEKNVLTVFHTAVMDVAFELGAKDKVRHLAERRFTSVCVDITQDKYTTPRYFLLAGNVLAENGNFREAARRYHVARFTTNPAAIEIFYSVAHCRYVLASVAAGNIQEKFVSPFASHGSKDAIRFGHGEGESFLLGDPKFEAKRLCLEVDRATAALAAAAQSESPSAFLSAIRLHQCVLDAHGMAPLALSAYSAVIRAAICAEAKIFSRMPLPMLAQRICVEPKTAQEELLRLFEQHVLRGSLKSGTVEMEFCGRTCDDDESAAELTELTERLLADSAKISGLPKTAFFGTALSSGVMKDDVDDACYDSLMGE